MFIIVGGITTSWSPLINESQRWTPTLEINTNTEIEKGPRTTRYTNRQTEILYCHSGNFTPWPVAACPARNYGPRFYYRQKYTWMIVQRYKETDRETDRHISSTGPHWSPSDLSVGINVLQHCTPTLEINTNTKIAKGLRTTRLMDIGKDILYWHSSYLKPCPMAACAARNYRLRFDRQKATQTNIHRERQRHRPIISTGPHGGPLNPSVG